MMMQVTSSVRLGKGHIYYKANLLTNISTYSSYTIMSLLNSSSISTTSTILNAKYTALDALCDGGVTIASDGAQYKSGRLPSPWRNKTYICATEISEFSPTDATTNPSLVYAAVCSPGSEYAHLLNEAVEYAFSSVEPEEKSVIQRTELALDYLVSVKSKRNAGDRC